MTNAVVWKDPGSENIWAVADSRVTLATRTDVRRVTDQAMKILRLPVDVHGETRYSPGKRPFLSLRLGLVYAGAVVPALMTHAAASMMLANLHPARMRFPRMHEVAALLAHLSERYIRDAAVAYAVDSPPFCEFVVFGRDVVGPALEGHGSYVAYWIHPGPIGPSGVFEQVMERIELNDGEVAVIGTETASLRDEIARVHEEQNPAWKGVEPRIALERRMRAQSHETVGGTLQFGLLGDGCLDLFGSVSNGYGEFQQNWLGFDCQADIPDVIGMPVMIPALR